VASADIFYRRILVSEGVSIDIGINDVSDAGRLPVIQVATSLHFFFVVALSVTNNPFTLSVVVPL
jgi:hypothetical protein